MCWSSAGYWETIGQAALLLHTTVWDWDLSLFTMPVLFSPQSKYLAQCPVLPGRADAVFRALQRGAGCPHRKYPTRGH